MFKYKKSLGQNFLVDRYRIRKIVELAEISNEPIVEIGPGSGALTRELKGYSKLYLIEKDKRLVDDLKSEFPIAEIFNEDFLKWNFKNILKEKVKVIGNIPYNITSPIIERLVDNRDIFNSAYMTIQREVAERLIAEPGDRNRSMLSFYVQLFAKVKILMHIPRGSFYPIPKVDSSTVSIIFNDKNIDERVIEIAKILFTQKRKQIINTLSVVVEDRNRARDILEKNKIDSKSRIAELSNNQILRIADECISR